jgi:hypothetical protein
MEKRYVLFEEETVFLGIVTRVSDFRQLMWAISRLSSNVMPFYLRRSQVSL